MAGKPKQVNPHYTENMTADQQRALMSATPTPLSGKDQKRWTAFLQLHPDYPERLAEIQKKIPSSYMVSTLKINK